MAFDVRVPGRVPKLAGLLWPDVAPYLEEFLKRLLDANDSAQTTLLDMDGAEGGDDPLSRRAPLPHTHGTQDVLGLDPGFRRQPAAHIHDKADVVGLDAVALPRAPAAHTHGTHDVQGLIGDRDLILASQVFGG